jgi:NADH:ubiquinone oxidoreductase subunit 3 (subunit A)
LFARPTAEGGAAMYAGVIAMAVLAALLVAGLYAAHRLLTVSAKPLVVLPFQSGWQPEEHALSRYHVRWYLATLVFLAFDVEMLFMYPWAVVVADMGATAVVEMFLFLGALLVAVAWAWREGALRWV